jgi:hypothetical protein
VEIISPKNGDHYSINGYSLLPLKADVFDIEQPNSQLDYFWTPILKHNEHEHEEAPINRQTAEVIIEPLGCSTNENYWYEIQLEVRDSFGLSGRDTVEIFPYCDDPFFELDYWRGTVEQDKIILNWSALQEVDVDFYHLQKLTSSDGLQTIAQIEAAGAGLNYHIEDDRPVRGYNNYRLKVYRTDGTFDFTPEIRILFPPVPPVKVYPNPTKDVCVFEVHQPAEIILVEIFDGQGKQVIRAEKSTGSFEVSLELLPVGVYSYRLTNGGATYSGKVMKSPDK